MPFKEAKARSAKASRQLEQKDKALGAASRCPFSLQRAQPSCTARLKICEQSDLPSTTTRVFESGVNGAIPLPSHEVLSFLCVWVRTETVPKRDQFREGRRARCPHPPLGQEESSSPWLAQPKRGKDAAHRRMGQAEPLLQAGGEEREAVTSEHRGSTCRPLLVRAVPCCHDKLLEGAGIWAFQSTLRRKGDQGTILQMEIAQNKRASALLWSHHRWPQHTKFQQVGAQAPVPHTNIPSPYFSTNVR